MAESEFTTDEITLLRRAAVLAGATVAITRYSGTSGTRDEFGAIYEGLREAAKGFPDNPLVQALVSDETKTEAEGLYPQFQQNPTQRVYDDFKFAALNRCAQAAELLRGKAPPEQAEGVKAAIVKMCEHVAQRAKEGSTLGLGGTRVDPLETAAIDQVKRALEV